MIAKILAKILDNLSEPEGNGERRYLKRRIGSLLRLVQPCRQVIPVLSTACNELMLGEIGLGE
jgi:hypothetical protein